MIVEASLKAIAKKEKRKKDCIVLVCIRLAAKHTISSARPILVKLGHDMESSSNGPILPSSNTPIYIIPSPFHPIRGVYLKECSRGQGPGKILLQLGVIGRRLHRKFSL